MPTKFDEIYEMYFDIVDDNDLKKFYNEDYAYKKLYDKLKYSIGIFSGRCYKELEDIIPFKRYTYEFEYKGDSLFQLDNIVENGYWYININDDETKKFNVDIMKKTIEIIDKLNPEDKIYISNYNIGQFNCSLSIKEKEILVNGMVIPFFKEKLNSTKLLNQTVYGKDYTGYSQAQHIKELKDSIKYYEEQLDQDIIMYSYKESSKR